MKTIPALAAILAFGIPLSGQQIEPIPTHPDRGRAVVTSIPLKPCGIFEKKGKAYRYVAGEVPPDVWVGKKKRYSGDDLKKITDAGGTVKILPHHFSKADLEKQQAACDEWYMQQSR